MHHLARHCVACFLTRGDLWQHWEEGARVFDYYLVDADWAVNNANWYWLSASAFFSQYFRVYSPISFAQKYDKNGNFIRHYVPELKDMPAKFIYEPWKAPLEVRARDMTVAPVPRGGHQRQTSVRTMPCAACRVRDCVGVRKCAGMRAHWSACVRALACARARVCVCDFFFLSIYFFLERRLVADSFCCLTASGLTRFFFRAVPALLLLVLGFGRFASSTRARVRVCVLGKMLCERVDPWRSDPGLQEVGDVHQTSHRRCSLMERDDLGIPKLHDCGLREACFPPAACRCLSGLTLPRSGCVLPRPCVVACLPCGEGGCRFCHFWVGLVGPLFKISFFPTRKVFKILWWVGLRNLPNPPPPPVGKQRPGTAGC